MKRKKLLFGLIPLVALFSPVFLQAEELRLPQPVGDVNALPYDTVGLITVGGGVGSGFVVKSPRVAVTAAHLFFTTGGNRISQPARWHARYHSDRPPEAGSGILLRRVATYTGSGGYAKTVALHGMNSDQAFEKDIAVVGSYEDLSRGRVGGWYDDGVFALDSNRSKRIVGYPVSLYQGVVRPANSPDRFKMHTTRASFFRFEAIGPLTPHILEVTARSAEETDLLAAPGNSGGPIFVQDFSGEWRAAGILVAGHPDIEISGGGLWTPDFAGRSGVRVFNQNDFSELINPAILAAGGLLEKPSLTRQPEDQSVHAGETVTFQSAAEGAASLTYQWQVNGEPLKGETDPVLTLRNVQEGMEGRYSVTVSNAAGSVTSRGALLGVSGSLPLGDALHSEHITWTSGGDAAWFGQKTVVREGDSAVQAGAVRDNQRSWIEGSITGPGVLTFWWKVSSEKTFDTLAVYVGDSLVASISGTIDWEMKRIVVPTGARKVRWVYGKDEDISRGEDTAWLDDVRFHPASDLAAHHPAIRRHYQELLGRNPGQEALLLWSEAISRDTGSEADLLASLLSSGESRERVAPLVRLYLAYFLRIPDSGGLSYWKTTFAAGVGLGDISNAFAGSDEFFERYGETDNRDFVTLVYQNVLEREPDEGGLTYWTGLLNEGKLTRGAVMTGFSESEEYRSLTLNEVMVISAYSGVLKRSPNTDEFFFWLDELDEGLSLREMVAELLNHQ